MRTAQKATRISAAVALILLSSFSFGFRPDNSVRARWTAYVVHTGQGEADIHFTADIPGGWKMYSQNMTGVDGPLPTSIEFDPNPAYAIVGAPKETGKTISFFEKDLGIDVNCLEGKVQYIQHIKYTETSTFSVKCVVNYMLTREGEILPPDDEDFTISVQP